MDGPTIARGLHVLAVVVWIGGVALVTTVALPAVRQGDLGADRVRAFQAIERRFVWQARFALMVVGATGFYMVAASNLWDRFGAARFWWMHAMVGVWSLFVLNLFIVEPLLGRRLERVARSNPDRFFRRLHRAHWVLLALAVVTILGAVTGSHGLMWFRG